MQTIAFDVDGTLIDSEGNPRYHVIDLLRWFAQSSDWRVIVWSGGGIDYARTIARRLGLQQYKIMLGVKFDDPAVDIAVDDMADGIDTTKQLNAKVIIKV